jgi:hypothetical protein
MKNINLNDTIYVQLFEDGLDILRENYEKILSLPNGNPSRMLDLYPWQPPEKDHDGYYKMIFHEFINNFGEHMHMGSTKRICNMNIKVDSE